MNRWQAFEAVCGHLRVGLLGGRPFDWGVQAPWELLVELSGGHNVRPALAWCLQDEEHFPADVRGYFNAVVTRNATRNERLLDGLSRVVGALNGIEIEPVLLKGAAHLVEGIYPAAGLRVVGDLDVLVPEDRAMHAAEALEDIGFVASTGPLPENHLHLPLMFDRESDVQVELHTRVEHFEAHAIVPAAGFRQSARPFAFRGLRVRLPDATRSVGHNIVHSQIAHEFDRLNRVELRQLLDLVMIRARQESAIDWAEIDHRFSAAGFADVLATYLSLAELLFGQPVPRLSGRSRPQLFAFFRSALERPAAKRPRRRTAAPRRLERVRARLVVRTAGFVDQIVSSAETTLIRGWAVDFSANGPARSVQIFINGRHRAALVPDSERLDVAAANSMAGIGECGFQITIPALAPQDMVQAFAELRGGIFAELPRPVADALNAWVSLKGIRLTRASGADIHRLERYAKDRDRRLIIADTDLRRLMAEVEEHERKLVAADADLCRLLKEVEERDSKLVVADADLRRLMAEAEERDSKLVVANADLRRLMVEAEERDRRLVAADADLRRLMAEMEERDTKLVVANADLRRLMAGVEERDSKLAAADADLRRLMAEAEERDSKLVVANADLWRLMAEVEERDRKLVVADADLRRLMAEVEERDSKLVDWSRRDAPRPK